MAFQYYDAQKYWTKKVLPVLSDPELRFVMERGLADCVWRKGWDGFADYLEKHPYIPKQGFLPCHFDGCDWRWGNWGKGRHGRMPRYWDYVCHGACHFLVDFNLRLAMLVAPDRPWRILNNSKATFDPTVGRDTYGHSTVWDGADTLFDLNFLALGVEPDEAFATASGDLELPPGKYLRGGRVGKL
jgi:hypothetical protein